MQYLAENIRKYRTLKGLTQEELAAYLNITAQSVSKWERAEACPDITFLPALANIFETSVDLLLGMDAIRAERAQYDIHDRATTLQREGELTAAEGVYRNALLRYPNEPGILMGLGATLALKGEAAEAIAWMERGLTLSDNEKQKATIRATLCFLYLQAGQGSRAEQLASELPHMRECREVIRPMMTQGLSEDEIAVQLRGLILG